MLTRWNRDPLPQKTEPHCCRQGEGRGVARCRCRCGERQRWFMVQLPVCSLYFAIAAGSVTHRDPLLENRVNLPFFNVQLPLEAFFILGPPVF